MQGRVTTLDVAGAESRGLILFLWASITQEVAFRVVGSAMKPELTDKVRPIRLIMIAMGGLLGGFFGVLRVYFRASPGTSHRQDIRAGGLSSKSCRRPAA